MVLLELAVPVLIECRVEFFSFFIPSRTLFPKPQLSGEVHISEC